MREDDSGDEELVPLDGGNSEEGDVGHNPKVPKAKQKDGKVLSALKWTWGKVKAAWNWLADTAVGRYCGKKFDRFRDFVRPVTSRIDAYVLEPAMIYVIEPVRIFFTYLPDRMSRWRQTLTDREKVAMKAGQMTFAVFSVLTVLFLVTTIIMFGLSLGGSIAGTLAIAGVGLGSTAAAAGIAYGGHKMHKEYKAEVKALEIKQQKLKQSGHNNDKTQKHLEKQQVKQAVEEAEVAKREKINQKTKEELKVGKYEALPDEVFENSDLDLDSGSEEELNIDIDAKEKGAYVEREERRDEKRRSRIIQK